VKRPLNIAGIFILILLVSGVIMLFVRIFILWVKKKAEAQSSQLRTEGSTQRKN
jgi:hypothetical protein